MSERLASSMLASDRKMIRYTTPRPPEKALLGRLRGARLTSAERAGNRPLFVLPLREGEPSGISRTGGKVELGGVQGEVFGWQRCSKL